MTQQHPITPPPELRAQWRQDAPRYRDSGVGREDWLMDRAAQWGADQELEACCEWLGGSGYAGTGFTLRAARRPKPPSLKEQALIGLSRIEQTGEFSSDGMKDLDTIRRALEQLPGDTTL
jgi:hypothetical protein